MNCILLPDNKEELKKELSILINYNKQETLDLIINLKDNYEKEKFQRANLEKELKLLLDKLIEKEKNYKKKEDAFNKTKDDLMEEEQKMKIELDGLKNNVYLVRRMKLQLRISNKK